MWYYLKAFFGFQVWRSSIDDYAELRALKFFSREELNRVIGLFYRGILKNCPHDLVGDNTVIIPKEAVYFILHAGFGPFKDTRVLSASELPPEKRYKLRMQQGTF